MAQLGGWVGYGVERWCHEDRSGRRWLVIALEPLPGVPRRCSGYGATIEAVHDRSQRRIISSEGLSAAARRTQAHRRSSSLAVFLECV